MTALPEVSIATPGNLQVEETLLTVDIEIVASPDTAKVELSINGEVQPVVDETPPYGFEGVQFPRGTWEVVAVATSIWENVGESVPVVLDVGVEPVVGTSTGGTSTGGAVEETGNGETRVAETTGESGSSDGGALESSEDEDGCGCRSRASDRGWFWVLGVVWMVRRRRVGSPDCCLEQGEVLGGCTEFVPPG
jgi:hypothetical protein